MILEQQRQMVLLQKNVSGLKSSLKLTSNVSSAKVKHFLQDNDYLLEQVNTLRQQIRGLTAENERLRAKEGFEEAKKISKMANIDRSDDMSEHSLGSLNKLDKHIKNKVKKVNKIVEERSSVFNETSDNSIGIERSSEMLQNAGIDVPPANVLLPSSTNYDYELASSRSDEGLLGNLGASREEIIARTLSETSIGDSNIQTISLNPTSSKV